MNKQTTTLTINNTADTTIFSNNNIIAFITFFVIMLVSISFSSNYSKTTTTTTTEEEQLQKTELITEQPIINLTNEQFLEKKETFLSTFTKIIMREGKLTERVANNYAQWIFESSFEQKINPLLLLSIIYVESRFQHKAVSHAHAIGLTQVVYVWHKEKVKHRRDLYDPKTNIKTGATIIRQYINRSSSLVEALLRYNGSLNQATATYSTKVIETQKNFSAEIKKELAQS